MTVKKQGFDIIKGSSHIKQKFPNTEDFALRDFGTIVGSVFQDPRSQFFMTDTTNEIAFGCVNMKLPREEVWERTKNSIERINISKLIGKSLFHRWFSVKRRFFS